MWTNIKKIKCYRPLAVQNNRACPDITFYLQTQKNGKAKISGYQTICPEPYLRLVYGTREKAEEALDKLVKDLDFTKVEVLDLVSA